MTATWVLRRTRREARRHGSSLCALLAAFAALAALAAAAVLGTRAAAELAPLIEQDLHVIAYLRDDASPAKVEAIADILRRLPGIRAVKKVESDEALRRLRGEVESLGNANVLLDGLEDGFLPRSLEVALLPSENLPARASELAARLRKLGGIAEVDAMESGLARLMSWVNLARWLGQLIFVLAAIAGLAALVWSLGKGRGQRRELAETLSLLGATPAGIRLPAAILGAAAAAGGCAVGLAATSALFRSVVGAALRPFSNLPTVHAPTLHVGELLIGLLVALGAGWLSGRYTTPPGGPRSA